ncbi:type II secretion system F family protein [Candidatus Falkowbacteria bacterium]|nr:type II secretion system F family protein [Candidatus Falkowbacteria bacterium]
MGINLSQLAEKNQAKTETKPQKFVQATEKKTNFLAKINDLLLKFSRIPLSEKLFFIQYLGIMLKAGISLSIALKTLAKQTTNKKFARIITDISNNVERGVSFTESLKPHEETFGQLFISMVESGEISGKLEEVLAQLYIQFKKQHELISKVKGALTYPVVIIAAMIGIGTFMMIVVVPQITAMFKEFNAELPLATKVLIATSDALIKHGVLVLLGLILFIILFIKLLKTYRGKYYWQKLLLKLPIFSPIIKKINLARFARTISSLLKTDIMIIKSFQITANVLGNLHYRQALEEMAVKIKKGGKINEVVANYPELFPPVVTQIISVGEETGELDYILSELAQFYEGEVDQIMNNLPSIIEPLLILTLGVVVGGMAVAIIMPMYTLTSVI